jgi:hypothetical protein
LLCPTDTNSYIASPACRIVGPAAPLGPPSVGPQFDSTFGTGGVFNLGVIAGDIDLTVFNLASYGLIGPLTDLTLLSATVGGLDAADFLLTGFTAGTVLQELDSLPLTLDWIGGVPGAFSVSLTFLTDEQANPGFAGRSFTFAFNGTITQVPEPTTIGLMLWSAGLLGLALRRRRAHAAGASSPGD